MSLANFAMRWTAIWSAPTPAEADRLRKQLDAWSGNAANIRPLLESNSLLTEDLPVADGLTALCKVGDEALSPIQARPLPRIGSNARLRHLKKRTHIMRAC